MPTEDEMLVLRAILENGGSVRNEGDLIARTGFVGTAIQDCFNKDYIQLRDKTKQEYMWFEILLTPLGRSFV